MDQAALDKAAYKLAKDFLLRSDVKGVTPESIERELYISTLDRPETLEELYRRILASGQSANMKPGVIGGAIGGVHRLGPVLCGFDPAQVLQKYSFGWEEVFEEIVDRLNPRGNINRTSKGLWPMYCRTILSGAKFLSQFASAKDFYDWVDFFDKDERARPALPMLVAEEIDGFGFALACDFLKELGYENFSKPDVHIKEIFPALGLCPYGASNYEVFKAVDRVARNAGVTPYNVDKVFWLIGRKSFGSRKKAFIALAQPSLERMRDEETRLHA